MRITVGNEFAAFLLHGATESPPDR